MNRINNKLLAGAAIALLSSGTASATLAQTRVTLPAGVVILVRTQQPLESGTAKVGQTFESTVTDAVSVNGYTLIPANSRIRGVVSYVQPATRQQSGVMQISFDRLTLTSGTVYPIVGRLTSTDSTERRQIDARADQRVVLVGERGGIGAAIAGAGSSSGAAGGILGALGSMLSQGTNVSVPSGTTLAVQLDQAVTLTGRGAANNADESTIFTAATRISSAQQALAQKSYYRGTATGVLDNATRRALFEFQLDNNITATGNLDGRTAAALGILRGGANGRAGAVLSVNDASLVRRAAAALLARTRQDLGISTTGAMSTSRNNTAADLELVFAMSAFVDNSTLYEQLVRASVNSDDAAVAGAALVSAERRVDTAMQQVRTSQQVQGAWEAIRRQLAALEQGRTR